MTKVVNRGEFPRDPNADNLYAAFGKINDKFDQHDDLKQVLDSVEKLTPVDADITALLDSEAEPDTPKLKSLSWASIKSGLKAYFDMLYSGTTHSHNDVYEPKNANIQGHIIDTNIHVSTSDKTNWNSKAAGDHNHDTAYEPKNVNIQTHISSPHAPANAQKNSDITKAEIEAKLTGAITSHTHAYEPANANIQSHISSITNPHGVTKAQVGLGNVENTSDANKPVSTAQQSAINAKQDTLTASLHGGLINSATAKTTPVDADMVGLMDSAASNALKKLSWANIKATLKTYFDTLYNNLQLGTGSTTAYRGDHGLIAYNHSQTAHAPSDANNYAHPTGFGNQPASALTGADVISQITVNTNGHVSGVSTRSLAAANIGAEPTLNADQKRKITFGVNAPSGGADNDIYLQYE